MSPTCAIIFVHGTWSSPKIWDKLENHLSRHLADNPVFERIPWSGSNSAGARRDGVEKLEAIIERHADKSVFVICHSHGANIVLETDERARRRIVHLVCLNSPILTTIKGKLPIPVWISFFLLALTSLLFGGATASVLAHDSLYLLACELTLVCLFFWAATTRCASVILGLFAIAATYPYALWLKQSDIPRWLLVPWLLLTSAASCLVVVLTIYAICVRNRARSVNPAEMRCLTQIVAIDDEIFLLLGLALALQRAIQFLLFPLHRLFRPSDLWFYSSMLLAVLTVASWFWPSAGAFLNNRYLPYWGWPTAIVATFGGLLVFLKLLLFGVAYGWDMAGLSINHAIYISPGSFYQTTDLRTLLPETGKQLWVSHTKIHQRESTLNLVEQVLKTADARKNA